MCHVCGVLAVCALLPVYIKCGAAFAPSTCNTKQFGVLDGPEVHVPDQRVARGVAASTINVPPVCARSIGVLVTACDADVAPLVYVSSLTEALVRREGDLSTGGYIYVTVFCDPTPYPIQVISSQAPEVMRQKQPTVHMLSTQTPSSPAYSRASSIYQPSTTQIPLMPQPISIEEWSYQPEKLKTNKYFPDRSLPPYLPDQLPFMKEFDESTSVPATSDSVSLNTKVLPVKTFEELSNQTGNSTLHGPAQKFGQDPELQSDQLEQESEFQHEHKLKPQSKRSESLSQHSETDLKLLGNSPTEIESDLRSEKETESQTDLGTEIPTPPVGLNKSADGSDSTEGFGEARLQKAWSLRPLYLAGALVQWWVENIRPWASELQAQSLRAGTDQSRPLNSTGCKCSKNITHTP